MTRKGGVSGPANARKASLITDKLLDLMKGERIETYGADYFRARRYVQRVLWSLDEAEIEELSDAGLRALFDDAIQGLRNPMEAALKRLRRKGKAGRERLEDLKSGMEEA
jgi:hypothetical protein